MRYVLFKIFVNNFIVNFFIRKLGIENKIYHSFNPYLVFEPKKDRSTQENAGYSNRVEINEVLEKSKNDLQLAVLKACSAEARILDIGCGPGMYLSLFKDTSYKLTGTDINELMLLEAKKAVPSAQFIKGNFIDIKLTEKYNFIYCIGVLIYISRQNLDLFLKKIYDQLESDGILYLNYPHALSWLDKAYNDLTYIQYSPAVIEEIIFPYFKIIKHEQAFDGRKVTTYDKQPYKSLNPLTHRTYKNSYLLICQKK